MDVGKEGIGIQGHPRQARLRQNTTLTKHTKTSVHYQGITLAQHSLAWLPGATLML